MVQKVLRGRGKLGRLQEMMDHFGVTRPMVVASERGQKCLPGMDVYFSDFHPNPDFVDCVKGAEAFRAAGCDGLISLGGGSAMDTAKGIKAVLMAATPEDALASRLGEDEGVPHIAVPTTAGSGAEATSTAVLFVEGRKVSLRHGALLPQAVVLDGALLDTLPDLQRKSCAMDALCQGIEAYWSPGATGDGQVQAYLAMLGVLDNLRAYLDGDRDAQNAMLYAAYDSGRAVEQNRTTAAHALSYPITQHLGIPHGQACMLVLPILWDHAVNTESALPILMETADRMRLGSEYMGSRLLRGIMIDLGLEVTQMPEDSVLDAIVDDVDLNRVQHHIELLTKEQIRRIYRRAFTPAQGKDRQVCEDLWKYYGK